jgi:ubiquinone/menaquinone biosynthesis C-methylase UbiE
MSTETKESASAPSVDKTGITPGYLHGFSTAEQHRLQTQARFMELTVYEHVDFSQQKKILELGAGVGAQTEILLRRFPHLQIQGIDASASQVEAARQNLAKEIAAGRFAIDLGDALRLPYANNSFDGAFVCWFLEHVQEPVGILRELHRTLKADAIIYCSEVLNATFYVHPYSPATQQYWFAFNDHQWSLHGDPFVGAKLANYLLGAGFQDVATEVKVHYYDNRTPKRRAAFIEYWTALLLSGAPGLIQSGKVTPELAEEMKNELELLKDAPDAVFFYSWVQARARAL